MKALLYLFIILFCSIILIGAVVSIIIFVFDVIKWHPREERVKIIPSAESVVIVDERGDNDSSSGADGSGNSVPDSNSGNNVLGSDNNGFFVF